MKKIMIVDDSITVARQLEKIISGKEFTVIGHAKNGVEAIKMHQTAQPDIICMDMNMPGMDGLTALRTLVSLKPDIKVVMITSLGGVGDKFAEAMKMGARAVISKPFEAEGILQALRNL